MPYSWVPFQMTLSDLAKCSVTQSIVWFILVTFEDCWNRV